MKTDSVETALGKVQKYLTNDVTTPFIVVVNGDVEYSEIAARLAYLVPLRTSTYCVNSDSYPNIDALFDGLSAATKNTLLLGFGESVWLSGDGNAMGRLKDLPLAAKVVVLCRNARAIVDELCRYDRKFNSRRVCFVASGPPCEIVRFPTSLTVPAIDGFRALLERLENGDGGTLFVRTSLSLRNVREVSSAYEAIRHIQPSFVVPKSCLSDALWTEFLANNDLDGYHPLHWRSFLKLKTGQAENQYLKYVADTSCDYDVYIRRAFSALLDFDVNDKRFPEMYALRKSVLRDVRDTDIAEYIAETKVKGRDRVYYLTDNTVAERQAIIEALAGLQVVPDDLGRVYPALAEYLQTYSFGGEIGDLLTEYFTEYKLLKLTSRLTSEFSNRVRELATDGNRPYNKLKTRGEVLDSLSKADSALYWIDALGVEYLGYIQSRAKALGLRIEVHVVRANLPTITSLNRDCYESWSGEKVYTRKLDQIKHDGEQDYNYQINKTPIHLAEELQIIDTALTWAKTKLAGKRVNKVILASDHGSSRLAVIADQECKWEMKSRGEHSGRCCPCSDGDVKSEYATRENDFWVLANYDRFIGGRKASVEVHGGATLEEVVVPVIEITLFDNAIEVSNITPVTTASYRKKPEIILFSKSILKRVSVRVLGKRYAAEELDSNRHRVIFPDIKRAGKYTADVFEGDSLIGQVEFVVEHEGARMRDLDLF